MKSVGEGEGEREGGREGERRLAAIAANFPLLTGASLYLTLVGGNGNSDGDGRITKQRELKLRPDPLVTHPEDATGCPSSMVTLASLGCCNCCLLS